MACLIEWRDEFRVGIPSVDYEHEQLIRAINDLHGDEPLHRNRDAVEGILGEIHAGIAAHFALEEKLMRDSGYAAYPAHKSEHDALLDTIREIMEMVHRDRAFDYRDRLQHQLRHWFGDHFKNADAKLHGMTRSGRA
jgi:hemerythrin-like metal-binding protein